MRNFALIGLLVFLMASCAVKPERLSDDTVSNYAGYNLEKVTADQEPVAGAISLYDAMARAVKYNLDFHVEMYNEALQGGELAVARYEMLPNLVANSAYNSRNNDAGGTTAILRSDRNRFDGDIKLSWNILDFGLSYVRAKQAADKVLVAEERRRKIINRIIGDVRSAYWRAVSAERLVSGLHRLKSRVRRAIRDSETLQKDGVSSPLTALTYQRELVQIQQQIQDLQSDLSVAKSQLAALMNVSLGQNFRLAPGKIHSGLSRLRITADEMMLAAMENRPEIRDVQYKLRINNKETKAALLELLPSASLFAGANVDTDSFLLNSNWIGWGAKASWNLMRIFKFPAKKRLIEAKDELLKKRALAVTMAIMTQVYVSRTRYSHARTRYFTASKHLRVQRGILRQIRESAAADQASEQTLIREEMNTLASRARRDIAFAELQNAYGNIYTVLGIDPYSENINLKRDVKHVASSLRNLWIERGARSGALLTTVRRLGKNRQSGTSSHIRKHQSAGSRVAVSGNSKRTDVVTESYSEELDENSTKEKRWPGFFSRFSVQRKQRTAPNVRNGKGGPGFDTRKKAGVVPASRSGSIKKDDTTAVADGKDAKKPGFFTRLASRRKQRIDNKAPQQRARSVSGATKPNKSAPASRSGSAKKDDTTAVADGKDAKKPGFFTRLASRRKRRIDNKAPHQRAKTVSGATKPNKSAPASRSGSVRKDDTTPVANGKDVKKPGFFSRRAAIRKQRIAKAEQGWKPETVFSRPKQVKTVPVSKKGSNNADDTKPVSDSKEARDPGFIRRLLVNQKS